MLKTHFPKDYEDARARFLERIRAWPCEAGHWSVPTGSGEELFVDHAYFAPTEGHERLFVLVSGIHGLEAYAGSAVQSLWFERFLPRLDLKRSGFLVVHGMNPFGFKYYRRATEAGVNLNRNCSLSAELYRTINEASLRYSERFVPARSVDSLQSHLLSQLDRSKTGLSFADVGMDEFVKAVSMGQYLSAAGFEYGGRGPEPQVRALTQKLKDVMPAFKDVILLDVHTGLGEKRRLHLLSDGFPASVEPSLFGELFRPSEDRDLYDYTPADAEGFYPTYGSLNGLFAELAQPEQRVCALTMEFGTLGHDLDAQLDGLNRWMLEHQGSLYGYASDELEQEVKRLYLERFYPDDSEWKNNVLTISEHLFKRLFKRTKIQKPPPGPLP